MKFEYTIMLITLVICTIMASWFTIVAYPVTTTVNPLDASAIIEVEEVPMNVLGVPVRMFVKGSGVFISENRLITAKHVVEDRLSDADVIVHVDGVEFQVVEIFEDTNDDLAVITVDGVHMTYLQIGTSRPLVGDDLICVGSPFPPKHKKLITTLAKVACDDLQDDLFVYDGFCWHGCSGGPVVHDGNLVGIINSRGSTGDGLGFATYIDRLDPDLVQ